MNQKLRTDILERDNRMCQKCGYSNIDCLEIHHIDKNPMNNNPSNLITFCTQCHLEEHNHRYNGRVGYLGKLKGNENEFERVWNSGEPYNRIMGLFHISFATVSNWRTKMGLAKRGLNWVRKAKGKERYTSLHTNILVEQDEWLDETSNDTEIPKAVLVREGIELVRQKREKAKGGEK